jgi:uncharacterized membrane protein
MEVLKNAVLIFALDIPWLYTVQPWAGRVFQAVQGSPLAMRAWPAVIVYLALGYLLTLAKTPVGAAALGAAVYAVYDFTNLATLKKYPVEFAIADTLWGGVLMGTAFWIKRRFF